MAQHYHSGPHPLVCFFNVFRKMASLQYHLACKKQTSSANFYFQIHHPRFCTQESLILQSLTLVFIPIHFNVCNDSILELFGEIVFSEFGNKLSQIGERFKLLGKMLQVKSIKTYTVIFFIVYKIAFSQY